jgi:PAS domain S-box-containing protein
LAARIRDTLDSTLPESPRFEMQGSRDSWRSVLANPFDGVLLLDEQGRYVEANGLASSILGLPHDQLVRRARGDLAVPGLTPDDFWIELLRVGQVERTLTIVRPDGVPRSIECRARADFAPGLHLLLIRDLTESSSGSEGDFRLLAEAMPQIVWITRADGWNIYFNQQWMNYTGLTLEESLGHGWNKPFHPEDQLRAWDAWRNATTTLATYSLECRLRRADGDYRWWLIRGVPVRDDFGKILKWFGTCTDIHDLKMAQLEVEASRARFESVFNSNLLAIAIVGATSGRFVDLNTRYAEFFGYARDEMIRQTSLELALWPDPEVRRRMVADIGIRPPAGMEVTLRHRSGEGRPALVSMESIDWTGETEPMLIQVLVDMQERKALELQLVQAQKMEAVGRLASGVAHDFNNALGVILGYTEMLLRRASGPEQGRLEQIMKAAESASRMTRQLLAFSRKEVVAPKILDLNAVLSDLEKMLGRLIGEDIDLALIPGEGLGSVKIDPGQLEQIVMNLCVNARDAMPDGGLLRIETTNVDIDAQYVSPLDSVVPGRYVMLAVSDSGCGIDDEIQAKIFEPFFTTKEKGKGTGLGLATVYGIVKQSDGHITVESELGHGTTFRIYLPRLDEVTREAFVEEALPPGGTETVLLVEDEEALRTITFELLDENGYRVFVAADGAEAQEIFRRHSEPIHLLITDVVMPGMNGRALAESLLAMRPGLKVLYMSGYTDDIVLQRSALAAAARLLHKPFSMHALLREVRAALGDPIPGETT